MVIDLKHKTTPQKTLPSTMSTGIVIRALVL